MDPLLAQAATTLGVGGFVAVLALMWKRSDDKANVEYMKQVNLTLIDQNKMLITTLQGNTTALSALTEAVRGLGGTAKIEELLRELQNDRRRGAST